jgi:hypothetical protein
MKTARLQEMNWTSVPAVADDIRQYPVELCTRIRRHFARAA